MNFGQRTLRAAGAESTIAPSSQQRLLFHSPKNFFLFHAHLWGFGQSGGARISPLSAQPPRSAPCRAVRRCHRSPASPCRCSGRAVRATPTAFQETNNPAMTAGLGGFRLCEGSSHPTATHHHAAQTEQAQHGGGGFGDGDRRAKSNFAKCKSRVGGTDHMQVDERGCRR